MLVPSTRLLWITALVLVPLFTVLGMLHVPSSLLMGLAALVGVLAALDAPSASARLSGVTVELTDTIRVSKGRSFEIEGTLMSPAEGVRVLEIGLPFPRELKANEPVLKVALPIGGRRSEVSWTVVAAERGLFHVRSAFVGCASRLGLWEGRREVPCQCEVRVYPDLNRERHVLAPLFLRRGALGMHQVRQLGKGREFEQLRAYLPGDSYEDIFWKGTAKRRFPVTRMYQVERTQEVYVVVDVSRRSARPIEPKAGAGDAVEAGAETQCERFIQAALILALAAEQQGDRFGLIIFSDQTHLLLPAGSGRAHYNACRDALYTQQPRVVSPDYEDLFISVGNRLRHRSLIIVLTDLGEPWLAESFGEAVRQAARKHVILAHMVGSREFQPLFSRHDDARNEDELYRKLAGHLIWHDLQDTARALKQTGVHLTASMEENLVGDVVSEYLKVKKRQLL
jgi:uncharacterized protein (DUF58 family)